MQPGHQPTLHVNRTPCRPFPIATIPGAVLLNTDRLLEPDPDADEAGEGWSHVEPGSQRVLLLTEDGTVTELAAGAAVAASGNIALVHSCEQPDTDEDCQLGLLDTTTGEKRTLEPSVEGTLGLPRHGLR